MSEFYNHNEQQAPDGQEHTQENPAGGQPGPAAASSEPNQNMTWSQAASVEKNEAQRAKEAEERAGWFMRLAVPSLIYALLYTVCTYHNDYGIGAFFWVACTLGYAIYLLRTSDIVLKKGSCFYLMIMGMLGVSTVLTTNFWVVFFNYAGFCLLLIYFLMVQTGNTDGFSIWDAIVGVASAFAGTLLRISAPVKDGYSWLRQRDRDNTQHEKRRLIVLGVAISIPAVLILGSLLMSADAVFGNMLDHLYLDLLLPSQAFGIIFTFLFGLFASYCGMRYFLENRSGRAKTACKKLPALVAQIFTTAILVLYVWFCLIQIVYLFGGFGTLPEGMTYASYARSGFFQLLAVCVLNLILVLAVKSLFEASTYLNHVLFAICMCSYMMTASSAYRMILYIQAYHLTVLRIVVLVALTAIAILLVGVCRSIYVPEFRILSYCVIVVSVVYTLFSFSHVESHVARYNLAYLTEDNFTDTISYLSTLSLDAVPATLHFLEQAEEHTYAAQLKTEIRAHYHFPDIQTEQAFKELFSDHEHSGWLTHWLDNYTNVLTSKKPYTWNVSVYFAKKAVKGFFLPD